MTVDEATEKILALRKLTDDCGVITRRTQSELLAALPADVLAEVAVRLSKHSKGTHDRYDRNQ